MGEDFSTSAASKIAAGTTNRQTVETLLGEPLQRSTLADGKEIWVYDYAKVQSDAGERTGAQLGLFTAGAVAGSFMQVPGLAQAAAGAGMMGVGSSSSETMDKKTLTVEFENDVVTGCMLQTTAITTSTKGIAIIGIVGPSMNQKTDTKEIKCGEFGKLADGASTN